MKLPASLGCWKMKWHERGSEFLDPFHPSISCVLFIVSLSFGNDSHTGKLALDSLALKYPI
jgi:hypothetical protein